MKKRNYDIPFIYNLKKYDNYKVFGAIKFYCHVANSKVMSLFYRFIRGIERRSKGEWACKVEGENDLVQRHVHALLGDGMKTNVAADLKKICIDKHENLKKEGKKQKALRAELRRLGVEWNRFYDNDEFDLIPFADSTVRFQEYDPKLGAEWYLGKKTHIERASLTGLGLDSVGDCNWKISHKMKERIKERNEYN